MYITEMEEKNQKIFLVLKITGFEAGTTNSHNPEQDIFIGSQCITKHP